MIFTEAKQISITTIPGTGFIGLTDDSNLTPKAIESGNFFIETELNNLDVVKTLKDGDVAVDVGGMCGETAIVFARNGAEVFVFEPQPDSYFCLLFNTRFYPKIHCYNLPVGDGSCVKLNQDSRDGNRLDVAKYDNEGSEYASLLGSIETIQRFKPKLIIEIYREQLAKNGASEDDIYDLLTKLGYEWEVVIGTIDDPRFDILATWNQCE
jgi:hypothetical protein